MHKEERLLREAMSREEGDVMSLRIRRQDLAKVLRDTPEPGPFRGPCNNAEVSSVGQPVSRHVAVVYLSC